MNDFIPLLGDHWADDRITTVVPGAPDSDSAEHVLVFGGAILDEDGDLEEFDYDLLHPPACGYIDIHTEDGTGVEFRDFTCGHDAVLNDDGFIQDVIGPPRGEGCDLLTLSPGLYETRFWHQVGWTDDHTWGIEILGEITSEVRS